MVIFLLTSGLVLILAVNIRFGHFSSVVHSIFLAHMDLTKHLPSAIFVFDRPVVLDKHCTSMLSVVQLSFFLLVSLELYSMPTMQIVILTLTNKLQISIKCSPIFLWKYWEITKVCPVSFLRASFRVLFRPFHRD